MQDFTKLQVWQDAKKFHIKIVQASLNFPKEETYSMIPQLRRASLSISNNIAEGCGRNSTKELYSFLNIAMGSTKEVENMINISRELNYINEIEYNNLKQKIFTIGKKLNSLMQKVKLAQVGRSPKTKNQKPKTKNIFRGDNR